MTESARESYVKGSLEQLPLPKAFHYVHEAGKSGILAITRGPKKAHIHIENGRIVHVTSTYFPGFSLGEYLVKEGRITQTLSDESFENTRTGRTKQGMYLVEHGHLSPHELFDALNTHVTLKLYRLFEWPDGDLFFKQGEIVEKEHRILKISMPNLVYVGIRDFFPMTTLPREFKGRKEMVMHRRASSPYPIEEMAFGPTGLRMYNIVNGQRTLRQLVAGSKLPKSQAYKVIYALFLLGFIGFPESLHESRRRPQTAQAPAKADAAGDGYEISVADDVIAKALASVDRIHEETRRLHRDELEAPVTADIDANAAPAAPYATSAQQPPAQAPKAIENELGLGQPLPPEEDFEPSELPVGGGDDLGWDDEAIGFADSESGEMSDFEDSDESVYTEANDDLSAFTNAEDLVKQAGYLIEEQRFQDAERFLERAIELDPECAEAYPYLGWCIYNNSGGTEVTRAESLIKSGMQRKQMYQSFLFLGKIYSRENQPDFAELHFVKAIELNIDCAEAKEEIKKIHSR